MASTKKTDSGKWSSRIYVGTENGKKIYKRFTAETKKEAEKLAFLYLEEHPVKKTYSDYTVRDAITSYIESKSAILSPSTVTGYEKIKRNWLQSIMDVKLSKLTKEMIQSAVNNEAALLSPKTVRNAAGLITAALAMFDYKVEVTLPQKRKKEIVIPTDEEMKLLCDKAENTTMMAPICLAAYMGMRRSEISALDLEKDIDLENKKLRISKAVVQDKENRYVLKGTKTTESERILPIPSILVPVLTDLIQSGKKIPNPDRIEKRFIKLRDSLGLKHITFHSLRHYFASTLVTLDIPDFYAMKLMGHNSDKMLKTVYQHVKEDYMTSVTQKMDDFFTKKNA